MTPLDVVRDYLPGNQTRISLLKRAMAESERIYSLAKVWHISDAKHAIAKAKANVYNEAHTRSEQMGKILAKTPPFLKERVRQGQVEVPRVEFMQADNFCKGASTRCGKGLMEARDEEEQEEEKLLVAVLKFVLRDEGEYREAGGMSGDVFVELLYMMAPKWDAIRGGGGGGEDDDEASAKKRRKI
jgi:hypothetical protein